MDVTRKKDRMLNVVQVKSFLNCSVSYVYRLVELGEIKAFNIGKRNGIRVFESEIARFLEGRVME